MIGPSTAVVVASAFSYPYGVMDPVADLAALAPTHGAGCHVDACIGGFVLPFLERLGVDVPPWDFRVPGVTEISADVHKYGYAPKGASVVLHRDPDWFAHQVFLYDDWPSGLYGSPGVAGARSAAPIATAWAALRHLGIDGYVEIARVLLDTTVACRSALDAIPELAVVGDPIGPVMAFTSTSADLDVEGWAPRWTPGAGTSTASSTRRDCTSCCRPPTRACSTSWLPTCGPRWPITAPPAASRPATPDPLHPRPLLCEIGA